MLSAELASVRQLRLAAGEPWLAGAHRDADRASLIAACEANARSGNTQIPARRSTALRRRSGNQAAAAQCRARASSQSARRPRASSSAFAWAQRKGTANGFNRTECARSGVRTLLAGLRTIDDQASTRRQLARHRADRPRLMLWMGAAWTPKRDGQECDASDTLRRRSCAAIEGRQHSGCPKHVQPPTYLSARWSFRRSRIQISANSAPGIV